MNHVCWPAVDLLSFGCVFTIHPIPGFVMDFGKVVLARGVAAPKSRKPGADLHQACKALMA